jgi:hypothetical protein
MHHRTLSKALVIAFAAMSMGAHAEEPAYAAKSLFFGEDGEVKAVATATASSSEPLARAPAKSDGKAVAIATAPKKAADKSRLIARKDVKDLPVGAAYFVRLKKPDGGFDDSLATKVFATGDKFQLGLKVNRPSFVYIFNEDPNGRITMLHPRQGRSAAVDAMGTVLLPAQGAFEFQGPPGLEKLLVLMSDDEVFQPDATLQKMEPDLVTRADGYPQRDEASSSAKPATIRTAAAAGSPNCSYTVADAGNYASKAIVYSQEATTAKADCGPVATPAYASKAIVFADDPQPAAGQQLASYVVKPSSSARKEPLLLKIQLVHR